MDDESIGEYRAALRRYFPDGNFGNRIWPLPGHGCVYVKNPKAGSSTVLLWLHRVHTGDHGFNANNIHKRHRLPRPADIGWDTAVRMLAGGAFRFSFVRDPISRAESTYYSKIVRANKHRWRILAQEALDMPVEPDRVLTFDQFVAALEAQDPLQMEAHWRPQHLNLMHGVIDYDLIGRLETFEADLARLCELTGLPPAPIQVRNRHRTPSTSLFDGRRDLLRRVEKVYAKDFELYGY